MDKKTPIPVYCTNGMCEYYGLIEKRCLDDHCNNVEIEAAFQVNMSDNYYYKSGNDIPLRRIQLIDVKEIKEIPSEIYLKAVFESSRWNSFREGGNL